VLKMSSQMVGREEGKCNGRGRSEVVAPSTHGILESPRVHWCISRGRKHRPSGVVVCPVILKNGLPASVHPTTKHFSLCITERENTEQRYAPKFHWAL
jgi:hypothetical protein